MTASYHFIPRRKLSGLISRVSGPNRLRQSGGLLDVEKRQKRATNVASRQAYSRKAAVVWRRRDDRPSVSAVYCARRLKPRATACDLLSICYRDGGTLPTKREDPSRSAFVDWNDEIERIVSFLILTQVALADFLFSRSHTSLE